MESFIILLGYIANLEIMRTVLVLFGCVFIAFSLQSQRMGLDSLISSKDPFQLPVRNYSLHQNTSSVKFLSDSKISDEDLKYRYNGDATRVLQNQAAGLLISANSYSPGASTRMILRGYRSFLGDNQPLILLNGLPYDNSEWNNNHKGVDQSNRLLDLDPSTIATVEVMKSIAGRARYGILGGNGVIHIRTKQENMIKPRISFSSTIGIDKLSNMPELQNTYAQGRSFGEDSRYRGPEDHERYSWGPAISSLYFDGDASYPYDKKGKLTTNRVGNKPAVSYDPYDFFQTGLFTNQSLHVHGKIKAISYAIGGAYMNQTGVVPTTGHNRYNFSTSANYRPNSKLALNFHVHLSHSRSKRNIKGSSLSGIMLGLLRTSPTFDNTYGSTDPLNDPAAYQLSDGSVRSYSIFDNPYWSLNKNQHGDKVNRQHIGLAGSYEFSEKLSLSLRSGLDNYSDTRKGGYDVNLRTFAQDEPGLAYKRNKTYSSKYLEAFLDHNFIRTGLMDVSVSYGVNYIQRLTRFDLQEGTELRSSNNVSIENAKTLSQLTGEIDDRILGGVAQLDIKYGNFMDVTASLRQDYSNKFGVNTNGFLSYGVGLSTSLLDILSLNHKNFDIYFHGSYGKFGNELAIGQKIAKYKRKGVRLDDWQWGDVQLDGYSVNSTIRNDRITAESINAFDVGVHVALGKRFNAGFLYYHEASNNLLMSDPITSSTGSTYVERNAGSMTNTGFEVSVLGKIVLGDTYAWSLGLDINKNMNKVDNVGRASLYSLGGYLTNSSVVHEGHAYGVIYGTDVVRNDQGEVVIDEHGFPKHAEDYQVKGDPNPDWIMNIRNSLNIGKNLSIYGVVDIKQGGDMYCGTCASLDSHGRTQESANSRSQPFIVEGVMEDGTRNTKAVDPSRYYTNNRFKRGVYDASWIRLRNVGISYDLIGLIKVSYVNSLSVGLYGENLFISTKYPGIDPETNLMGNSGAIGFDYFNNPGTKRYGINIKAIFGDSTTELTNHDFVDL